jgi:hypothetical protein
MEWKPIHQQEYDRDFLGAIPNPARPVTAAPTTPAPTTPAPTTPAPTTPAPTTPAPTTPAAGTPGTPGPGGNRPSGGGGAVKKKNTTPAPVQPPASGEPPSLSSPGSPEGIPELTPLSGMINDGRPKNDTSLLRTQASQAQSSLIGGPVQRGLDNKPPISNNFASTANTTTPSTSLAQVAPAIPETVRTTNSDQLSTALLAKRLGISLPGTQPAGSTQASATTPIPGPITINQYAAPAGKSDTAPAPARRRWFHREKPRPKIQLKSTTATGMTVPAPAPSQ